MTTLSIQRPPTATLHSIFPPGSDDVALRDVARELITTKVGPALGDGDLFAGFQIEPLAAILVSLGMERVADETDIGSFAFRLALWDALPDNRKFFQIFGGMDTIKKYVRAVALLTTAGWDFEVKNNTTDIGPLSDAEFIEQTFIQEMRDPGEVFVKPVKTTKESF